MQEDTEIGSVLKYLIDIDYNGGATEALVVALLLVAIAVATGFVLRSIPPTSASMKVQRIGIILVAIVVMCAIVIAANFRIPIRSKRWEQIRNRWST